MPMFYEMPLSYLFSHMIFLLPSVCHIDECVPYLFFMNFAFVIFRIFGCLKSLAAQITFHFQNIFGMHTRQIPFQMVGCFEWKATDNSLFQQMGANVAICWTTGYWLDHYITTVVGLAFHYRVAWLFVHPWVAVMPYSSSSWCLPVVVWLLSSMSLPQSCLYSLHRIICPYLLRFPLVDEHKIL